MGVARGSELGGVAGETREVVLLVDHQEVEDELEQIGVSCPSVPVHCHYPDVIAGLLHRRRRNLVNKGSNVPNETFFNYHETCTFKKFELVYDRR